jgi:hypothetical protein
LAERGCEFFLYEGGGVVLLWVLAGSSFTAIISNTGMAAFLQQFTNIYYSFQHELS